MVSRGVSRAATVSSVSKDNIKFQECFKRQQQVASVSRVSRAFFKECLSPSEKSKFDSVRMRTMKLDSERMRATTF